MSTPLNIITMTEAAVAALSTTAFPIMAFNGRDRIAEILILQVKNRTAQER